MRQLLFGLMILFPFILFGQNVVKKTSLTNQAKEELMTLVKDLYDIQVNVSFNITLKDLQKTFEDMSDGKKYDKNYLNDLLRKLGTDNLNPVYLNNIADYYSKNLNFESANEYYSIALKNLDIKYFNNDSAFFYSFRGLLKANMNDTTAIFDFYKSIEINPNDSISMLFFPLILIKNSEYEKAREVIIKMFNSQNEYVSFPYFYLTLTEVFESIQNIVKLMNKERNLKKEYAKKDYKEIVNYKLLDEYLIKYRGNNEIENCRIMADLLGIFYKFIFFDQDSNYKLILNYTKNEKTKIHEIISIITDLKDQKKLNDFTVNKCLGYAYFMTEEWKKSVECFKNAIEVFPVEKKDEYFGSIDCYDAITTIFFQTSDTLNFRIALNSKMANEKEKVNTIDELTLLAFDFYRCGDIVRAEEYCKKIRELNTDNFDALRLLSHINFLKGYPSLTQFYGEIAGKYVRNDLDNYKLIMQFAIYQIYNGDFKTAISNIEIAKSMKGTEGCLLCDKLIKIIEDNK